MLDDIRHEIVITYGDTTLAPVRQYNVVMYSVNSHTCLSKELAWHLLSYPPVAGYAAAEASPPPTIPTAGQALRRRQPHTAAEPVNPRTCWKYALEAIIKWLLLYFLVHNNCLLFML